MSLNLGLSTKKNIKNDATKEYVSFLEEELATSPISAYEEAIENLINIDKALKKVNYSTEVLSVLAQDPIFNQILSQDKNPSKAIAITISKSEENLMQDFLRWGVPGMVFGAYLASIGRISKILKIVVTAQINISNFNNFTARSIYLPSYKETTDLIKGLNIMHKSILTFGVNPTAGIKPVINGLRSCGFNVTEAAVVAKKYTVDWGAVLGDYLGGAVGSLLGPLSLLGKIGGAHILSSKGDTMQEKGYDPEKYKACCAEMLKLIEKLPELKHSTNNIKTLENVEDINLKIKFVKSATKIYLHTIKNLGRGLASAYTHIK